jgi:hypothetical protein
MSAADPTGQCSYPGCGGPWTLSCHHGAWCGSHILAHQEADEFCRKALAEAVLRIQRELFTSVIRLRAELWPVRHALLELMIPVIERIDENFYVSCRDMYEAEGAPFGSEDDDMWRWFAERLSQPEH